MSDPVLILGAGPAGLATAAMLQRSKVAYRLLDRRGVPGGAYNDIYGALTLSSPRVFTQLPGLPPAPGGEYITAAEVREYLARYVERFELRVEKGEVTGIRREGRGFRVHLGGEWLIRAPAVVVATGMWDFPTIPEILAKCEIRWIHAKSWYGVAAHPEERILVVGAATAGVEIAEEIARAGRKVWVSARSGVRVMAQRWLGVDVHHWAQPLEILPLWAARSYCARRPTLPGADLGFSSLRRAGKIDVRPGIAAIDGHRVRFADGSDLVPDLVVAATGFQFRDPFLPADVERAAAGHVVARRGESVSWPGLFVVGTPCAAHINSEFLRGIHRDAPRIAERVAAHVAAG